MKVFFFEFSFCPFNRVRSLEELDLYAVQGFRFGGGMMKVLLVKEPRRKIFSLFGSRRQR